MKNTFTGRKLPWQVDHCKKIIVSVSSLVLRMPHVTLAQVLARNCLQTSTMNKLQANVGI